MHMHILVYIDFMFRPKYLGHICRPLECKYLYGFMNFDTFVCRQTCEHDINKFSLLI